MKTKLEDVTVGSSHKLRHVFFLSFNPCKHSDSHFYAELMWIHDILTKPWIKVHTTYGLCRIAVTVIVSVFHEWSLTVINKVNCSWYVFWIISNQIAQERFILGLGKINIRSAPTFWSTSKIIIIINVRKALMCRCAFLDSCIYFL